MENRKSVCEFTLPRVVVSLPAGFAPKVVVPISSFEREEERENEKLVT